jgi:hypothetical protein
MKTFRFLIPVIAACSLFVPALKAQDFSRYREFSLGTDVATILKRTDKKVADVNTTHSAPNLFQDITWWPPSLPSSSYRSDSVEQILFSFYNGELYKISVTYGQGATEGLTAEDMVKAISATYGPPTSVALEPVVSPKVAYDSQPETVASWEDARFSFNLVRTILRGSFGLLIYSKRANTEAELGRVEATKTEKLDAPAKEAERQKKQTDDLALLRQKNQKNFRP